MRRGQGLAGGRFARANPRRSLATVLGTLALMSVVAPGRAWGDERELYTLIGYEGGVGHHEVPVGGEAATTRYAGAIDLTAYYGLTNAVHVGGRLRLNRSSNLRFSSVAVVQADGSTPTGDVFLDELGMDVGGIVVWRVGTGRSVAPVLELGAGLAVHEYRNIAQYRSDGGVASLGSTSEAVAYGSGTVLVEYRFRDRWVVSGGVGVQVEGGRTPWSVLVPIRVGLIW